MLKKWTARFWRWLYAHARAGKPWNRHLEALRTWFLNTFDPMADHAKGQDKITDHQWNNVTLQRVEEHKADRKRWNLTDMRLFETSRNWSRTISRAEINARKKL